MEAVAVWPSEKKLDLVDHPEPKIESPTQVKLRMLEVGVCGTDKEIAQFQYGIPPAGFQYLVLGHESLAEVVEVGPEVRGFEPGDLGIIIVRRPCDHPECVACRAGRQDFCMTGDYHERGIKDLHGYMTDLIVEESRYIQPIPKGLRDVGVLVEPLTIAEKAFIQVQQIQKRLPWSGYKHKAVVLGAGPVGLLGAMVLVNAGFQTWVYSRSRKPNEKAAVAEAIGAEYVSSLDIAPDDFARKIGNIDLIYEAVGASQFAFEVLATLGHNGIFVFTGVPSLHEDVTLDTGRIMRNMVLNNQVVMGTVNAGRDAFEGAVRDLGVFLERWPKALRSMITHRFERKDFRDPVFGRADGIKNVIVI